MKEIDTKNLLPEDTVLIRSNQMGSDVIKTVRYEEYLRVFKNEGWELFKVYPKKIKRSKNSLLNPDAVIFRSFNQLN